MKEMKDMQNSIQQLVGEITKVNDNITECQRDIQLEKATTEHIKSVLKKTLSGKTDDLMKDKEEIQRRRKERLEKQQSKNISIDKFLAIMQALKNEKEIGKFKMD